MLKEFRVDNFKSLINVVFQPREQNLLLGTNNAGKTNLCQAMRFLADTARLPLVKAADHSAGTRDGLGNFFLRKDTIDFDLKAECAFDGETIQFDYHLTISTRGQPTQDPNLEVETETLDAAGEDFGQVRLLENSRGEVRLLDESSFVGVAEDYIRTSAPRDATMLQRLYDVKANPRANCFKRYLSGWQYYALSPHAMRMTQHWPDEFALHPEGANLASVIFYLKTVNERQYRLLMTHLRAIEPAVEAINFIGPTQNTIFMSMDTRGNRLPAFNASEGTLRYLAMLYIFLAQSSSWSAPVVIIEEPENGIYVGLLKDLFATVREAPVKPQLIFTTHSPYFIDLFDDRLDSIFVMKRGAEHSSIHQPDPMKVKARLEQYPLGEQHFREMLG